MLDRNIAVSLAGSPLSETRHVCALFGDDDEEYRVLMPFIQEGFDRGDRAIHVVNPEQRAEHLSRLSAAGIDAASAQRRGQFQLRTSTDLYLPDGRFNQERMLATFEQLARDNAAEGFGRGRIVCRMGWAAANPSLVDEVIEFESRVNEVWRRYEDVVICSYQLGQFGGGAVIDIMRTHPVVIIGSLLYENPFYIPPDRFVPELQQRRAKHAPGTRGSSDAGRG